MTSRCDPAHALCFATVVCRPEVPARLSSALGCRSRTAAPMWLPNTRATPALETLGARCSRQMATIAASGSCAQSTLRACKMRHSIWPSPSTTTCSNGWTATGERSRRACHLPFWNHCSSFGCHVAPLRGGTWRCPGRAGVVAAVWPTHFCTSCHLCFTDSLCDSNARTTWARGRCWREALGADACSWLCLCMETRCRSWCHCLCGS